MNAQHQKLIETEIYANLKDYHYDFILHFGYKMVKEQINEYVINLPQSFHWTVLNEQNIEIWVQELIGIMSDFDVQASDDREAYQQHYTGNDSEPDYIPREV